MTALALVDINNFDGWHFLETLLGGLSSAAVFFLTLYKYHRADVKDRDAKAEITKKALLSAAEKAEAQNETRHAENRQSIHDLVVELRYKPLHVHRERSGPLGADGIDYGPKNGR